MADERLGPIISAMLECARVSLTNPVNRVLVMPGSTVVDDDCCEGGGQLFIRVVSIVGASGLAQPDSQPCTPLYKIRCAIGTRRCAHTVSDAGVPPSAAEMTADAFSVLQDRADIMEAFSCCIAPMFPDRYDIGALRIEDWLPSPVLGGCIGCEITFTFSQVLCNPCP